MCSELIRVDNSCSQRAAEWVLQHPCEEAPHAAVSGLLCFKQSQHEATKQTIHVMVARAHSMITTTCPGHCDDCLLGFNAVTARGSEAQAQLHVQLFCRSVE